MAINSSTKFGVVYTTPTELATKLASDNPGLVTGKLYFAAGATSGAIGQGLYVYNDGSDDGDNSIGTVAMVGAGSVVDGNHAGLVSPALYNTWNQTTSALDNYLLKTGGTLTGTLTSQNVVPSADSTYTLGTNTVRYKTIYADSFVGAFSGTATNATNASTADVAKKVDSSLYIKVKGTTFKTYDASDAITFDISAGNNISLSTSGNTLTIAATDTKYSGSDGISLSGTTFSHADTTNTTADTSYGPTADASQSAKGTITIKVPEIKVDKFGHVSDVSVRTFKILDTDTDNNTWRAVKVNGTQKIASTASTALDLSAGANISLGYSNNKVTIATTGVPTITEMNTAISTAVSSLFKYVGDTSATPTSASVGQTWRASSTFTIAATNSVTGAAVSVEVGDVLLCTAAGPIFTVIQNNITNNVSFTGTPTNQNLVMFDGATGQVKNSGIDVTALNQTISSLSETYAPKSHTHNYANIVTGSTTTDQILVSNSNGTFTLTNLSALKAGDASSADQADKVANTFDISVGGSDVLTFNGSVNKTIAFKGDGSTSVTHSNGVITIGSTNTVYSHPASISGTTLADSSLKSSTATSISHGGTFTVATGAYRDASGHISKVATQTFKLPSQYSHPASTSGTTAVDTSAITAASPSHGGSFTVVTGALRDASGHISKVTTQQITLPGDNNTDTKVTTSASTSKLFIIGKLDASKGVASAANYNASVYINSSSQIVAASGAVASNNTALVTGGTVYTAIEAAKTAATVYWETLS